MTSAKQKSPKKRKHRSHEACAAISFFHHRSVWRGPSHWDTVEALCRDFGLEFRSLEPAVLSSVAGEAALWNRRHKHAEARDNIEYYVHPI
eukprot:s8645_g1.t1